MAIFKCKMCGGDLEILENATVCECEYCGTKQTVPVVDNEKKLTLFNRANKLRLNNEFDKAAGVYESIVSEFPEEAESYWGLVLCKYGIEYVEDGNGRRIPTCHRTLPVSVMDDDDFEHACEYADATAKTVYRNEAKAIDKIQKKILKIAHSEEPYDIFICYKETDDSTGARTEDSLIAQDIYTRLIKDDYRVFFARDSLREVAGVDYEPYIYAALSSAKIMLAIGTKYEYYDAVWVKNEWSRFISMMGDDSSKVLIPCFKNMDAYDMPKEFKNMQALDMGEVTFFGDLVDNIERVVGKANVTTTETVVVNNENVDIAPLLERGFIFLEDEKWQRGDDFFELVLNKDPKNATAYLGKLLVDLEVSKPENLKDFHTPFDDNDNYQKIMRFASAELKKNIKEQNDIIVRRNEENRKRDIYEKAVSMMEDVSDAKALEAAGYLFLEIKDFNDAKDLAEDCFEKAEIASKNAVLAEAKDKMAVNAAFSYSEAIELLEVIPGWKDADELIGICKIRIEEIRLKVIEEKREQEKKAEEERKEPERKAEIKRV
ncbi:MAG: TIR domain-containing protein, partial [Clostridia bacterium]|nr:TIR domain-containing protein [Clostridia bacterium]